MPKKTTKYMKAMNSNIPTYKQGLQHNVEKAQVRDKIKPNEIFETNKTKGVHGKKKNGKK
jgi:hypothetical protein